MLKWAGRFKFRCASGADLGRAESRWLVAVENKVCNISGGSGYSHLMAPKIATANVVGFSELLDFIRPRHKMVLTTFRADASLQTSPVTGGIDGQGRVVIASYPQRAKSVNIRRNPKASLVVLSDEFNGAYVQLDGDAEVIDGPDAVELLVDYYRVIAGEHPDWQDYRRAMLDQGKCLIRVTPRRWGPVATGGFPPT
jgi:PPOX class probable F420-dependent enzyme